VAKKKMETEGDEKEYPRKFVVKSLAEASVDLNKLLKNLKIWVPKLQGFH
jgi:hypothetical protein